MKTKNINVKMPEDLYFKLVRLRALHKTPTWAGLFEKMTDSINGGSDEKGP